RGVAVVRARRARARAVGRRVRVRAVGAAARRARAANAVPRRPPQRRRAGARARDARSRDRAPAARRAVVPRAPGAAAAGGVGVAEGTEYLEWWWMGTFRGLAIFTVVLAFNFLGDSLRDIFDPRTAWRTQEEQTEPERE